MITYLLNKYSINKKNKSIQNRGSNIVINGEVYVDNLENLHMGNYVFLNDKMRINSMSTVKIGNNVIFGPEVILWSTDHNYKNAEFIPYDYNLVNAGIEIGDNVWVGGRSTILPGVKISEGAIVGMGSVVTKDVPYCAIVGGNPAKILKYRDIEHYEQKKLEKKLYLVNKYNQ